MTLTVAVLQSCTTSKKPNITQKVILIPFEASFIATLAWIVHFDEIYILPVCMAACKAKDVSHEYLLKP